MNLNYEEELFKIYEELKKKSNDNKDSLLVVSSSNKNERATVKEFYGKNFDDAFKEVVNYISKLSPDIEYVRLDLVVNEKLLSYDEFVKLALAIPRNNYGTFGFRIDGKEKRLFLKEEIVGNAILKPDKDHRVGSNRPNLQLDENNLKGYIRRKYFKNESVDYFKDEDFYVFETVSAFIGKDAVHLLEDYGNGNHVREINTENFNDTLEEVILNGTKYLNNQIEDNGKFIYGYFPAYGKTMTPYNSIRHFSSLYALAEAAEYLNDESILENVKKGLIWGLDNLLDEKEDGTILIKEPLKDTVEYKLGAQAMAILALAKYSKITGDDYYYDKMEKLIYTIADNFIAEDGKTIHVLNEDLSTKEDFRIVYYDGEALFAILRAYELMKDPKIFAIAEGLMNYFVDNNYEKFHDHWLSYAVNEMLEFDQRVEYYKFGVRNAMNNIRFIEKRDTAYPTMLELLCAAYKMMLKLDDFEDKNLVFDSEEEYLDAKQKIKDVAGHRAKHEIVTGVMLPEFAMYFKYPVIQEYGFFARHDRLRMRIDDAEHFLSGLINYQNIK